MTREDSNSKAGAEWPVKTVKVTFITPSRHVDTTGAPKLRDSFKSLSYKQLVSVGPDKNILHLKPYPKMSPKNRTKNIYLG